LCLCVLVVAGMRILTIIIVVVLCLVAVQVVVVVVYIAAKRYYYDYVRQKMRLQRLQKLAMFIPAASARIHRMKRHVTDTAQRHVMQKIDDRRRSESVGKTAMKRNQDSEEHQQTRQRRRSL